MPDDDHTLVGAPTVAGATTATGHEDDDDRHRSRTGLWFLLGLLLVLLIGGAAYLLPGMFESPPEQDRVPDVIGMREDDARAELGAAGFAIDVEFRTDPAGKQGRVLEQDPNADQFVEPGSLVTIVVSEGRPLVDVPFVLGFTRAEAEAAIEGRGLDARFEEEESDEPRNQVVATEPAPNESVPEGSTVTVLYSDGPEEVPGVVGLQQREAERILTEAGFEPRVVETTDTTEPRGTVVDQEPGEGERADEGDVVTIVVSAFEEQTESPSPSPSPTEEPTPTESPSLPTETPAALTDPDRPGRQGGQRMGSA